MERWISSPQNTIQYGCLSLLVAKVSSSVTFKVKNNFNDCEKWKSYLMNIFPQPKESLLLKYKKKFYALPISQLFIFGPRLSTICLQTQNKLTKLG